LTKQLTELQGDQLTLTSEVGIGTTVFIQFPAVILENIEIATATLVAAAGGEFRPLDHPIDIGHGHCFPYCLLW
jgi:hypothetical protein